jgi:hypothetical protein
MPSLGSLLKYRNTSPTCQSKYWSPSLSPSNITEILEHTKITNRYPPCCDTKANMLGSLAAVYILSGSNTLRQMLVYTLQTKYKQPQACTWSDFLNILALVSQQGGYVGQLCILYSSNILVTVRAASTWNGMLDFCSFSLRDSLKMALWCQNM